MNAFKTKPSLTLGSFSVRNFILLAAITLIALALRVIRLDFQPLWWDEGYSVFFATRDFPVMLARTAIDIHPPLYYALLRIWMSFFGQSDIAARLLSVFIGVATVLLIYALARKLFPNTRLPLLAALLLALSPLHIYYSQEVRMYGLVTLLGLASVYLFVELIDRLSLRGAAEATQSASSSGSILTSGKIASQTALAMTFAAYILVTTAALYTQYYAAFILAFEILAVLMIAVRNPTSNVQRLTSISHWLFAWLTIALLYLPWVIYAGPKLYDYVTRKVTHEAYPPLDPLTFLAQHLSAFSVGHLSFLTGLAWGSVAFVALVIFGMVKMGRVGERESGRKFILPLSPSPRLLVSLYLFVPLALGFVVNLFYPFHPVHNERLQLLAVPAFYLLASVGIEALWKRRAIFGALPLVAVVVISATSLYDFYNMERYPRDDYRPLIAEMQTLAQPGDVFLAIYPWQVGYLESYYHGAPLNVIETPSDEWIKNPAQLQTALDGLQQQHPRVWLPALQTLGRILEGWLDAYLRPRDYSVLDTWFGNTRLQLFARASDPPLVHQRIAVENGPTLSDWGVSSDPVASGQDLVRLVFDWGNDVPGGFRSSLRLLDSKGNLWAQEDREIASDVQRIGFAIPTGTPPGEYDLRLKIYRFGQPEIASDLPPARVSVNAPAQPNLAAIRHRIDVDFGNGIRLVGYDTGNNPLRPGMASAITLYWQATRTLKDDYVVAVQVQDDRGKNFVTAHTTPTRDIYPSSRWQPNELVRDPQTLTLRGDTPDGDHHLLVTIANQTRDVGMIRVKGRTHYFGAPQVSTPFNARFGDVARLVGYQLNTDPQMVTLVLYWQSLAPTPVSYKVFVHVVDMQGNIIAQRDQFPGNGSYLTTTWVKDEYLSDFLYVVPLVSALPRDSYQIEIGMYDPTTGERLPVFDAEGKQIGDHIIIK